MQRSIVIFSFAAVFLAGCVPSSPLPPVDQVTQIRLSVARMPDDKAAEPPPRGAVLDKQADIAEVMAWLNAIDWSKPGQNMAAITIPRPDGGIVITTKAGATQDYGFYWDGGFINGKANRFMRGGDMAKWKQIVERHCK